MEIQKTRISVSKINHNQFSGGHRIACCQHGVLCKQGWTFKLRLFASLYFGTGWTEFCWAFSYYLVILFLYWASVPGWTINNALPAQSPDRYSQCNERH
jgi:hypothetical protein